MNKFIMFFVLFSIVGVGVYKIYPHAKWRGEAFDDIEYSINLLRINGYQIDYYVEVVYRGPNPYPDLYPHEIEQYENIKPLVSMYRARDRLAFEHLSDNDYRYFIRARRNCFMANKLSLDLNELSTSSPSLPPSLSDAAKIWELVEICQTISMYRTLKDKFGFFFIF